MRTKDRLTQKSRRSRKSNRRNTRRNTRRKIGGGPKAVKKEVKKYRGLPARNLTPPQIEMISEKLDENLIESFRNNANDNEIRYWGQVWLDNNRKLEDSIDSVEYAFGSQYVDDSTGVSQKDFENEMTRMVTLISDKCKLKLLL